MLSEIAVDREHLIQTWSQHLGQDAVLHHPDDRARYETGWRYGQGQALLVARPSTVEAVSWVLREASQQGIPVVVQGANTGLVGASVPDATGRMVVLSLERLNRVLEIDPLDRVALVEGGVLLSTLNEAASAHGLFFPVDLGADPQLGGMVATNTGGTRLIKYGDVRANLLGLEGVLMDGTVVSALSRLRKNNTGLDPRSLFTGTFGALGVITRAVVALAPRPRQQAAALVGCASAEAVLRLLQTLERQGKECLSAFEVISDAALAPVFQHQPSLRNPYGSEPPAAFTVLVEFDSTLPESALNLSEVLQGALENHWGEAPEGDIQDVFFGKPEESWAIRHHVSESHRHVAKVLALDLSVPRRHLPAFRAQAQAWISTHAPWLTLADFGHWGDGGVHFNLLYQAAAAPDRSWIPEVQGALYALAVEAFQGSYSAEHGVGPHNQTYHARFTPEPLLSLGRVLKDALDPQHLLGTVSLG